MDHRFSSSVHVSFDQNLGDPLLEKDLDGRVRWSDVMLRFG